MAERMVKETLETFSGYDFDGSVDSLIEMLHAMKARHPGKELKLDYRQQEHDDYYEFALICTRPENETEIKAREERERQTREYRRKMYEEGKKEFGP